ncbi:MAG: helix-turn-helix domain-containing protein [Clostridia bacterium]|nr:helix-turn-helix domain-containing protein [Clostridia bacterium]
MENKNKQIFSDIKSYEYSFTYGNSLFTFIADDNFQYPNYSYDEATGISDSIVHFHKHYEIFYVYEGEIILQLENQIKTLGVGELLIVSPEYFHKVVSSDKGKSFILNFVINKSKEKTDFKVYSTLKKVLSTDYLYLANADILYTPLKAILDNITTDDTSDIWLNLYEFVTNFLRLIKNHYPLSENKSSLNSKIKRDHKLHLLLNNGYHTDLSIESVAKTLHLSTRQTNRIIHKNYNCGFREIIRTLRMNQAAILLTNSDMNITDIAQCVGYSSICGFYTAFSQYYNQKPSDYRKKHFERKSNLK